MNEIELKKLWDKLSGKLNVGSFEDFKLKMSTTEQRKRFFDKFFQTLKDKGLNLGNYQNYESRLGTVSQNQQPPPEQTTPEQTTPSTSFGSDTTLTADDLKNGKSVGYGKKGDIVGKIQENLIKHGFTNISKDGKVDRVYGSRTRQSVVDFQKSKNLKPDGIVGPKTWAELIKDKTSSTSGTSGTTGVTGATTVVPSKPVEPGTPYTPTPADVKKTGGGASRETTNINDID